MNPWLSYFYPQLYLPFSFINAQNIEPNTNWFFSSIDPIAGNGSVEQKIFEYASYGRQLGLIIEVLLGMVQKSDAITDQDGELFHSLERLKKISETIDTIKNQDVSLVVDELKHQMADLKRKNEKEYRQLLAELMNS
jgi:hypothetical protein